MEGNRNNYLKLIFSRCFVPCNGFFYLYFRTMQKIFSYIFAGCLLWMAAGCGHSAQKNTITAAPSDSAKQHIFPLTSFLKGQLIEIDTMPVTPLKIVIQNGRTDSSWLRREDIRKNAAPFLTPRIDSASMTPFFAERAFLDQTINAFTFSYDPKTTLPDSLSIIHWDIYIKPETSSVSRVYIVKKEGSQHIQLTWVVNKWYSIRTITEEPGKDPQVTEEKIVWDFKS